MLDETDVSQLRVTLLIINMQALTLHLWVINRCPVYHSTFLPLNQRALDGKDSITGRWLFLPPSFCSLRTCPHGSRHVPSMMTPALYLLVSKHVKMKRKISGSSLCYLYSISCYHVGVKFHRNLFFHFVFLLFPVRHYVATAIITHRYKYHPLPLLVDLQIFSVSTPFSNTISCETSIYKIDKGKLW